MAIASIIDYQLVKQVSSEKEREALLFTSNKERRRFAPPFFKIT